jgi:hypothetical protein
MASALVKKLMPLASAHARNASTMRKVCVIGAAGGIGQPLGLLMKMVRARRCAQLLRIVPPRAAWRQRRRCSARSACVGTALKRAVSGGFCKALRQPLTRAAAARRTRRWAT